RFYRSGLVTAFTILFELLGGISLIIGYQAQIGAILLLVFLIPATLMFHNPIADPTQMIQFMKNLAIMGGLLMVVAFGAGPISLDRRVLSASQPQHSRE
ncbi:MAG: DoxX family protein, partial [Cyanobacteria bacterium J06642_11]